MFVVGLALPATVFSTDRVDFSRDVQPILADKCFHCHGPDAGQRKAGLRLDTHEGAMALDKDGIAAVVPGNTGKSDLIRRIFSKDADEQMPPPKSKRQLSPQQAEVLKTWIERGAPWDKHWSFIPPVRPELPAVKDKKWGRNPIDAFILARLEAEGMHPSPEASKEKLIRRVALDLTGIPPTPEEVDAFVADHSPDAYEKVVDRLLASPRYGERMALPWLDAARYADTNGFQEDRTRTSWIWRDWVVKAMNDNMPFDEFTIEQIAGDLLPNATNSQKLASGFNRNHMLNGEGGAIAEESRNTYVIDRVNTTSTVWLGLTLGCCQCHDHKYDPFTQKEYYQLFAYFNNLPESGGVDAGGNAKPVAKMSTPEQDKQEALLKEKLAAAESTLKAALPQIDAGQADWEKTATEAGSPSWAVITPTSVKSDKGATLKIMEDGSVLAGGKSPATDIHEVVLKTTQQNISGLRIEALTDESLPHSGPGRSEDTGNFVLTQIEGEAVPADGTKSTQKLKFAGAEATYEQAGYPIAAALGGNPRTGWAVWQAPDKQKLAATLTLAQPVGFAAGTEIHLRLHYESKANKQHTMGRFRVSLASGKFLPAEVAAALAVAPDKRSPAQKQKLAQHYRNTMSREYRKLNADVVNAKDAITSLENSEPEVMVMQEMPRPRETFVHVRGQYDKFGDRVFPGIPAAISNAMAAPATTQASAKNQPQSNRLDLARWLVAPENPLTARVAVNRYWQLFFGTGIVKTTEDFGIQGERPSHPELLDWLATEFMASHWNVKAMHRLIVTSAAYRQSSSVMPELLEKDPENRLIARSARFRLSSFALRDQALAVSGLLVEQVGGSPVKPYQPPGLWEEFSFNKLKYEQDHGDSLYRRSLYTFWRRTVPPTMMFDTPSRQLCTVRQTRTNTPLQSLILMNEPTFVESARIMAERLLTDEKLKTDGQRLAYGFRLCTARQPSESELKLLQSSLDRLHAQFQSDPDAAKKLLAIGEKKRNESLDLPTLAAYSQVCDLLLNLDETLTKE
jgi:hypothetical protein